jgi:hypothetical protein
MYRWDRSRSPLCACMCRRPKSRWFWVPVMRFFRGRAGIRSRPDPHRRHHGDSRYRDHRIRHGRVRIRQRGRRARARGLGDRHLGDGRQSEFRNRSSGRFQALAARDRTPTFALRFFAGRLVERFGPRTIAVPTAIAQRAGALLAAHAQTPFAVVVAGSCMGIAWSAVVPVGIGLLFERSSKATRGLPWAPTIWRSASG